LTVYDLTPIVTPQYHALPTSADFSSHCKKLLDVADVVLVLSRATASDVQSFADGDGLSLPTMVHLPVGSDLLSATPTVPRQMEADASRNGGRYVLTVGTVEIRKNHHLLLDVWEMLVNELGPDEAPRLVVAGQRGWIATETMARLTRTPSLSGVVSFIERPTDAELAWLYRNCEFTVYPALYEGWGLPVSESLDFNKMCLTTNGSSLPESGEGLTELLDPFDRAEWKSCILRFWTDRALLASRELKIRSRHRPFTGRDTTRVLLSL
jgi:glycosyltransferase involved in cell wall biosynthesis